MENARAALITGGTGRVGNAIAARLQAEGFAVLAAGRKDGDIAIFSAHPFAPEAMVEYTLVDGRILFERAEANTLRKIAGPGGQR